MLRLEFPLRICACENFIIKGLIAFVGVLVLLSQFPYFARAASDQKEFEYPSLNPSQTEIVIEGDKEFVDKCMTRIRKVLEKLGGLPGRRLITKSQKFGSIFRLDYELPADNGENSYVNRVVCWGASPSSIRLLFIPGGGEQK